MTLQGVPDTHHLESTRDIFLSLLFQLSIHSFSRPSSTIIIIDNKWYFHMLAMKALSQTTQPGLPVTWFPAPGTRHPVSCGRMSWRVQIF